VARPVPGEFNTALCLAAAVIAETASREPPSEPADDCELALRDITGLRLEAAVEATIFLVGVAPFSPLPVEEIGGGRISAGDGGIAVMAVFSRFIVAGNGGGAIPDNGFCTGAIGAAAEAASFRLTGGGGGGMSDETAVLPEDTSPSLTSSSSDPAGDTKRAVGRGPEVEGPLDFLSIGWVGGGLEDEGVGYFVFDFDELDSCPWSWLAGGTATRLSLRGSC